MFNSHSRLIAWPPAGFRYLSFVGVAIIAVSLMPVAMAGNMPEAAIYVVYKGERPVLKIIDRPGTLTSTALPPPGVLPPRHPFLTATALAPAEEGRLRQILEISVNTSDFLDKLRRAAYIVRRQ